MDDERLLAEALRAQAAGGVSSPGVGPGAPAAGRPVEVAAEPGTAATAGPSRLRDRFRPLTRSRRTGDGETSAPGGSAIPAEPVTHRTPAPPYTAPTTAGRGAPPAAGPPMPRPAPGTAERPWPPTGPRPPARPTPGRPMPTGPLAHPGPGPGVPHPRPATGPQPTGVVPARPVGDDDAAWTSARIAWWSGVALLVGAVAGALTAVGTLVLPG